MKRINCIKKKSVLTFIIFLFLIINSNSYAANATSANFAYHYNDSFPEYSSYVYYNDPEDYQNLKIIYNIDETTQYLIRGTRFLYNTDTGTGNTSIGLNYLADSVEFPYYDEVPYATTNSWHTHFCEGPIYIIDNDPEISLMGTLSGNQIAIAGDSGVAGHSYYQTPSTGDWTLEYGFEYIVQAIYEEIPLLIPNTAKGGVITSDDNVDAYYIELNKGESYDFTLDIKDSTANLNMRLVANSEMTSTTLASTSGTTDIETMSYETNFTSTYILLVEAEIPFVDIANYSVRYTKPSGNFAPTLPSPSPADGALGVSINPTLSVFVTDPERDRMDVRFYNAIDDSLLETTFGYSGTTITCSLNDLSFDTSYLWYVIVDDGINTTRSSTWTFTTQYSEALTAPDTPILMGPGEGITNFISDPVLSVRVNDPEGDPMTVLFYNAENGNLLDYFEVESGNIVNYEWIGLMEGTSYWWYVKVYDGYDITQSPTYWFTIQGFANIPPDIPSNLSPSNGTTDVDTNPTLAVSVNDPDGNFAQTINVRFYNAENGNLLGTDSNVNSGYTAYYQWMGLNEGTTYSWYAIADDRIDTTQSPTWSFTTQSIAPNIAPNVPSNPSPADRITGVSTNPILSVYVSDPNHSSINVFFYDSNNILLGAEYNVASGDFAYCNLNDLTPDTPFSWYVLAHNGVEGIESPIWIFTPTENGGNTAPPDIDNFYPLDGDECWPGYFTELEVNIYDIDDGPAIVRFYDASNDNLLGEVEINSTFNEYASMIWSDLVLEMQYSWYVTVEDEYDLTTSDIWTFSTPVNTPPWSTFECTPINNSENLELIIEIGVFAENWDERQIFVSFYEFDTNKLIGQIYVQSGSWATVIWTVSDYDTYYSWYAVLDDGNDTILSSRISFKTKPDPGDSGSSSNSTNTNPDEKSNIPGYELQIFILISFGSLMYLYHKNKLKF